MAFGRRFRLFPWGDTSPFYAVIEPLSREQAVLVCSALLDVIKPVADWQWLDAWSDYRDSLPADVSLAQARLRELQVQRGGKPTGMGIEIDRSDPQQEELLRTYAPWSIHAEFRRRSDSSWVASIHDGANSVSADLTAEEADDWRRQAQGVATIARVNPVGRDPRR